MIVVKPKLFQIILVIVIIDMLIISLCVHIYICNSLSLSFSVYSKKKKKAVTVPKLLFAFSTEQGSGSMPFHLTHRRLALKANVEISLSV